MSARLIRRSRLLPYHGTVKVEAGEWVQATDLIAELEYVPGLMAKTTAARQLTIGPQSLSKHMLHEIGAKVEQGDPLAASFMFGEGKKAESTISGYVGLISNSLGTVYVRQPVPVGDNEPVSIDLAAELGLSKLSLLNALRVQPRRMVTPGHVLAVRYGSKPKSVESPIYGRVASIVDGVITIMPTHIRTALTAYLTGRVQQVIPRQGAIVEGWGHVIQGVYGVGQETGGELLVAAGADEELPLSAVTPDWQGKIVVAGRTASLALLNAAAEVGCAGLVVASMSAETLAGYGERESNPGLTGEDTVSMPIMLTDRFSQVQMQAATWRKLSDLAGRYASMSGTTHIRAGLVRPELIVCETEWPEHLSQAPLESGKIRIGDSVRVLRQPYMDQIGTVLELPEERQQIVTGSHLRVAHLALGDQKVTLPLANLTRLTGGDE